jgi:hypothetical protein
MLSSEGTHMQREYKDEMTRSGRSLDVIDIHLPFVPKFESALSVLLAKYIRLVDFGIFWKFAVRFDCETVNK